jgi:hypothetical protein
VADNHTITRATHRLAGHTGNDTITPATNHQSGNHTIRQATNHQAGNHTITPATRLRRLSNPGW